ncbi:hypothetical protein [Pandoraea communis]|uniref:hypothetical protein n=1 Tax=Pandoraea communis TaxID=2508297 RepID=UPI0025A68DB8|nr:hypothetical protein [Pandoraea communis]MDM8358403.1 hypothetical protein [Pandoraea communis]
MENIELLLGVRYEDLGQAPILAGIDIPLREAVVDQSYVSFPALSVSLVLPDNERVGAVQLHASKHDGFGGYAGRLPGQLKFEMNREDARAWLGVPVESGKEREVLPLGKKPAWDRFRVGQIVIHVEYSIGDGPIQLLTITRG